MSAKLQKKMEQTKFLSQFSAKNYQFERTGNPPTKTLVPGQAVTIRELWTRFTKGQRLNIHVNFRPENEFVPEDQLDALSDTFEHCPPPPDEIMDIVDVEAYAESVADHKRDFESRMKKKKENLHKASEEKAKRSVAPDEAAE